MGPFLEAMNDVHGHYFVGYAWQICIDVLETEPPSAHSIDLNRMITLFHWR